MYANIFVMQSKCLFLDISRPVILRIQEILSDMEQNEDDLNTPIYIGFSYHLFHQNRYKIIFPPHIPWAQ